VGTFTKPNKYEICKICNTEAVHSKLYSMLNTQTYQQSTWPAG